MLIVVIPLCPDLQGWKSHYYIFHILQVAHQYTMSLPWHPMLAVREPFFTSIWKPGGNYDNMKYAFTMPWQQTGQCWCFQTLQCKVILEQPWTNICHVPFHCHLVTKTSMYLSSQLLPYICSESGFGIITFSIQVN